MFVQSDVLGVGFAGAVVRLAQEVGVGVDQTLRHLELGRGHHLGGGEEGI